LKTEQWGSQLAQEEKYQEEKPCDKKQYKIIIIIIIIITYFDRSKLSKALEKCSI